ncbi:hypothetical protein [Candidatus Frankia alpina]|uniref:hypothetical protein n=1 Tax=Candidatus Frankia alpina TaxID=2699483 RepID=UPI0013D5945F|nr:hypothetical protein [Candidatus Frankia alpina]
MRAPAIGIIVEAMSSDREIQRWQVEIIYGVEPVHGFIDDLNGLRIPFSGWLQFLEAAERLRAAPSGAEPEKEGR